MSTRTRARAALLATFRRRAMNLSEAAATLHVDERTLRRWLNGDTRPSIAQAALIESEFGVGYRLWWQPRVTKITTGQACP